MNNTTVTILDVFAPSEAQIKKNIFGTINVQIVSSDGLPVARLMGMSVRKNKEGKRFLAMPSYELQKDGEKKYFNHFSLFPHKHGDEAFNTLQKARMDKFTEEVLRVLDQGGTHKKSASPAAAAASAPSGPKKEPWDTV